MPKIIFRYGTMNSSKTANLLMIAHNFKSQNKNVFLIKPDCDTRFENDIIKSRALDTLFKADLIMTKEISDINIYLEKYDNIQCILVDECQFLSFDNINSFRKINLNIPIICYGLRTDYKTNLFEGSKRLLEIADEIEETKTICVNCSKKAIINAKYYIDKNTNNKCIIKEGTDDIELGYEDKYQSLCWNCWII